MTLLCFGCKIFLSYALSKTEFENRWLYFLLVVINSFFMHYPKQNWLKKGGKCPFQNLKIYKAEAKLMHAFTIQILLVCLLATKKSLIRKKTIPVPVKVLKIAKLGAYDIGFFSILMLILSRSIRMTNGSFLLFVLCQRNGHYLKQTWFVWICEGSKLNLLILICSMVDLNES